MSRRKVNSHRFKRRIAEYRRTGIMPEEIRQRLEWDKDLMYELFPALRPSPPPSLTPNIDRLVQSYFERAATIELNKPSPFYKFINIEVPK